MREPVHVLVAVAAPSHGASDRVRLADLVGPLDDARIQLREWVQPRLALPPNWTGDPVAAAVAGRVGPSDLASILWADVIWIQRFAAGSIPDPEGGAPLPTGFDDLLLAVAARRDILRGRPIVYDIDANLLDPRPGTAGAGAAAQLGQVDLLLDLADLVIVATPVLHDALAARVPANRLRVVPTAVDIAAYRGATRTPGRLPVIAAIDGLDGPGGLECWVAELARGRREGLSFRSVRLADPGAEVIPGFDEDVRVNESGPAWPEALARIAPDIVLAPIQADPFGRSATALTWLEATAVGAATLADSRAPGPYACLEDGRTARLVAGPGGVVPALAELLACPDLRTTLAAGALETVLATATVGRRATEWADAFRAAVELPLRSGDTSSAAARDRRAARRDAIARARADSRDPAVRRESGSLAVVGVIPADPANLGAALDAARRVVPPPVEIVLAGDAAAIEAAQALPDHGPSGWSGVLRWVTVDRGATIGEALAAALQSTTAGWVAILDTAAELRPHGLAKLVSAMRENGLDAAYGELAVADATGVVEQVGAWPPTVATFRSSTLVVDGELARGSVTPATAELDDPILDWLLALMEAGRRIGSAGVPVAREIAPDARRTRIRSVGAGVPYADGGEDRMLGIVGHATDRRSTSDVLARSISDWTTRCHLSRLRGNLVHSIAFPPGSRVIDVGAGTGTIARALGERGLDVVALEGSFDRARVAALRCADLPAVEVIHGTAGDYEDPAGFDAVVVVGVLEYSGSFQGGAAGPAAFLGRLRRLMRPDGVLVLAIENRLGLKYLQGYCEDHLARPWVGIERYGNSGGIRTWSRRALRAMLAEAGFTEQRWRYPFPDYKLPTLVLDEAAYREPDAEILVDALVRDPIHDYSNPRPLVRDDRGAHQGFLEAGLGEDVANSFLVVAAATQEALARYAPLEGPLAWLYGDERVERWLRRRTVEKVGTGRVVRLEGSAATVQAGGLRQVRAAEEVFVAGPTLEQELKASMASDGVGGMTRVLGDWVAAIDEEAQAFRVTSNRARGGRAGSAGDGLGPVPATTDVGPLRPLSHHGFLPGAMLDLVPSNFIRVADGSIVRVDREWQLPAPIDRDIALFRALWYLAGRIVRAAWATPWPAGESQLVVALTLASAAGVAVDEAVLERFQVAETWLQARVQGGVVGA